MQMLKSLTTSCFFFILPDGVSVMDWQKLFVCFSFIVTFGAWDQEQTYQYDMLCAFKPCPLEIKSNSGLKQGHLELCHQPLKALYLHYHNTYGH